MSFLSILDHIEKDVSVFTPPKHQDPPGWLWHPVLGCHGYGVYTLWLMSGQGKREVTQPFARVNQ